MLRAVQAGNQGRAVFMVMGVSRLPKADALLTLRMHLMQTTVISDLDNLMAVAVGLPERSRELVDAALDGDIKAMHAWAGGVYPKLIGSLARTIVALQSAGRALNHVG